MDDVKTELLKIENANEISREQFSTDSEYVLALTHKMLEDSNVFGVSFDQLAPLVNRLVWEKQIQEEKMKEEVQHILQNLPNALGNSTEPPEKKLNDTEKEMKEIHDSLYAKLQQPGRQSDESVTFKPIVGLNSVKTALDTGIQVPLQRPELVRSGDIKPYEGILLFGPPGTGKSMMAKALANEARNCSYIQVDRADLVSKWQGQSEKMVNALFNIARKNKPCIIFVDEIEGLLEDRDGGEGGSNGAKVVTVLLTAMQNLSKDQVFVLGASNYPWKLDKAFLRRFSQIIYVPLPTLGDRVQILKQNIYQNQSTTINDISIDDIEQLALLTEQYSGSHLSKVVVAAMAIRYQRVAASKYFKRSIKGKNYWQPCTKHEEGARQMSIKQVPKLVMPPLIMQDLELALSEIKNNIDTAYLKKLVKWGEKNSDMRD